MAEGDEEGIKITLLGNPGVGKTCIISKYVDDTFNEDNESTIGANYSEKIIKKNGKDIQLNIWDTAGQEKFHSLGKHFYKDSYIVCFVYDITNQESLDSLKEIWYPDLQKFGEKYTVLAVVGNKCDLYESDNLANEEQAKAFAKEINATFMLTSAKNGDGIEKLFSTLTDIYLGPEFSEKAKELKRNRGKSFSVSNQQQQKSEKSGCC
jgi:Ras-related protein Rab-1A